MSSTCLPDSMRALTVDLAMPINLPTPFGSLAVGAQSGFIQDRLSRRPTLGMELMIEMTGACSRKVAW